MANSSKTKVAVMKPKPKVQPKTEEVPNKIILILSNKGHLRDVEFEGNASSFARGGRLSHWAKRISSEAIRATRDKILKRKYAYQKGMTKQ